ncbi:MAG: ABC transporter ATP-binding protein, partial [Ruminococcus sp.]|nr:ABC transporter ATP-binding protein [Ruminococcus sp.]
ISRLYGMTGGTFLPMFGTAEPQKITGEPQVFVIGGGGSGIDTYRSLQRQGIPFAAGVIHENDIEYPTAKALASVLITEKAFEPVSSASVEHALEAMNKCGRVICCIKSFGTMNMGNKKLLEAAEKAMKTE